MDTCTLTRSASLQPESFDEANNSVEVIFATETPVARQDFEGAYLEILSCAPGGPDLERLNAGGPVLRCHDATSLEAIVGSVEPGSARVENGRCVARLRLATTPDAADVLAKVKGGILRNVSVGYAVNEWQDTTDDDGRRTRTATRWTAYEISLVPIPADAAAMVRADDRRTMARPVTTKQILAQCRAARLPDAHAIDLLEQHEMQPFTRDDLIAEVGTRWAGQQQAGRPSIGGARVVTDHLEHVREGIREALTARLLGRAPGEQGRAYAGLGLPGLTAAWLEARGERGVGRMTGAELWRAGMNTMSDFPTILMESGSASLVELFQRERSPLLAVAWQNETRGFGPISAIDTDVDGGLEEVPEGGDIPRANFSMQEQTYRLKTFARTFSISRQAFLSDWTDSLSSALRSIARLAIDREAQELAGVLTANGGAGATLSDNLPLFHASRGNVASAGAALDLATLTAGIQNLRLQKLANGGLSNARAAFIVVGPESEVAAHQLSSSFAATVWSEINPWGGILRVLVDPRITGKRWWLFADPAQFPIVGFSTLQGGGAPTVEAQPGWNTLSMEWRAVYDFGAGPIGHVGAHMNPGA